MPSLPTDSLYKFLAIAGIAMIMWGVAFPWNKSYDYRIQLAGLDYQTKIMSVKMTQLEDQYRALTIEAENIDQNSKDYEIKSQTIRQLKTKIYAQSLELRLPQYKERQKLAVSMQAQELYAELGIICITSGSILGLIGFVAWYTKIQRHIDKELCPKKPLFRKVSRKRII